MTPTLILTPCDRRSTVFFWLGIGVFPLFWSWFTLSRKFANWQRILAFAWLSIIASGIFYKWPQAIEWLGHFITGLPVIGLRLTCVLFAWLFLRVTKTNPFFSILFFALSGNLGSTILSGIHRLSESSFVWFFLFTPIIPAMLHLALKPPHEVHANR